MDVILHIGAHRCATTSFQHYLRMNAKPLSAGGIGSWGPRRTRNGLFRGILPRPGTAGPRDQQQRAIGRVRMNLERSVAKGLTTLVVSDENMLGSVRENLRLGDLYSGAGERMARFHQAFDGRVSDVVLNIRSLDSYWRSALGYGLTRGVRVPGPAAIDRLVRGPRRWRDVIADVACAVPGARIWVLPFEIFAGRPDLQLAAVTAADVPRGHAGDWLNASPGLAELRERVGAGAAGALPPGDGRWQPFDAAQSAVLRRAYAEDLTWLRAGADGLAWLMEDPEKRRVGQTPPHADMTRGRHHEHQKGRMAGTG